MNKKILIPLLLMAMLLLAAYAWLTAVSANPLSSLEKTQQAATTTAVIPSPSPTSIPSLAPIATETLPPLPTLAPTQIPTQIPTPLSNLSSGQADNPSASQPPTPTAAPTTAPLACDWAGYLGDVTIPDGTVFNPGDTFTKVWQLKNIGACSWSSGSALVFVSGDLMGGSTVIPLPSVVNPGDTIDLSVNLTAPSTSGTYQGNWMLQDAAGRVFGTGANANQSFWVNIAVTGTPSFAVTSVSETANPVSYTGNCPVTIAIDANITSSSAGTVTYYWKRSDGTTSAEGTLTFSAAGTQTVEDGWVVTTPGTNLNGWDQIYIDQPNHQLFDPISFTVICNPPTATPTLPAPTATPTQPAPTATPTQPAPTATPTRPVPTATPTLPAPTATPTQPAPTATPTQPASTATPTQPAPTATPTQPAPTATPTQPAPTATPTQPAPTATPTRTSK